MVYKKFYIKLIVRVIFVFLSGFAFIFIIDKPNLLYIKAFLLLLTLAQLYLLIHFLNRINRKLALFFDSVKTEDYTVVFKSNEKDEFYELDKQLDQLSKHFKEVILKREEKDEYFKAVLEHVGIGVLAFDDKGLIRFINNEALKIFGLNRLKNLYALDMVHSKLSSFFFELSPNQQQLLELSKAAENLQLAAKLTKYKIAGEDLNLVSLQNIKPELDLKETETWQKMIRILTHEIMNSVSPITSLANSLANLIKKPVGEKSKLKIEKGLKTIENRGEGMMEFVRKYRNLTILPLPQITSIPLKELMTELKLLFEDDPLNEKINFSWKMEKEDLLLKADREQIEQVLINLIKNAIWAVQSVDDKSISIEARDVENKGVVILVADSGIGISDDLLDKIFIPFFTSRDEGSGIGLSLSRQIMLMHSGSISVNSTLGEGTQMMLNFPKS